MNQGPRLELHTEPQQERPAKIYAINMGAGGMTFLFLPAVPGPVAVRFGPLRDHEETWTRAEAAFALRDARNNGGIVARLDPDDCLD